jgi:asparaginyl-tRNA synthetase
LQRRFKILDQRFAEEQKQKPEKDRAKEGLIEKLENVIKNVL